MVSGGKMNSPATQRVFWALMEGALAAVPLVGGGIATYGNTKTHAKAWNAPQYFIATKARQQGQYNQTHRLQHRTQVKGR